MQSIPRSAAPTGSRLRVALLGASGAGALFALVLFAYELALARVPQHRAALERLVRVQTGLDVRFTELGLRWGWYGPEAVFRDVELDEPGGTEVLLRAPELVVGFDAWRTLRSGHPEAGRIELAAPDIDFATLSGRHGIGAAEAPGNAARAGGAAATSPLSRVAMLQRWRGGRIDIEGGTLRLPDPGGGASPFNLQIRRASLRRSDNEWNVSGLVFLPERVGRSARVTLHVTGDLREPAALSGALRVEARRLLFPGCRDFLAGSATAARYLPRAGHGDATVDLDFEHGRLWKANGTVRAGGVAFASPASSNLLVLDGLRGDWRAARVGTGWRIRANSLDRVRGELAGLQLGGMVQDLTFDWEPGTAEAQLRTAARLEDVAIGPQSKDFTLAGMVVRVSGTAAQLRFEIQSRTARLELPRSQHGPLTDVHVTSTLRLSASPEGWQIDTDGLLLEHQRASLSLSGTLQGGAGNLQTALPQGPATANPQTASVHSAAAGNQTFLRGGPTGTLQRSVLAEPHIFATGTLTGADIPLVMQLLGDNTAQAFGAAASRLTSGRIENAEFALHGPLSTLPFAGGGFTGSLTLRDAVLSGGDLWPDADGIDARVEWHGARIQATIAAGRAGSFQLSSATAQWSADGAAGTHLTGHVNGRLENAIAWVREHPQLQEYAPEVPDIDASGNATLDFNVSIPANFDSQAGQAPVSARVSTFLDGASVQAVAGLPPLEGVTGAFVFDSGRLRRTALTGSWLGGPVTLRVGERHEKGERVLTIQALGTLKAQQLAAVANAAGTVAGATDWSGELTYLQADGSYLQGNGSQGGRWSMRADSNLLGVASSLPEPFAKRSTAPVPMHMDVTGAGDSAQMHASLGDRLRCSLALQRRPGAGWAVERGAVRFGAGDAVLPSEPVVLVRGRLSRLDLPAYALAWQRLSTDTLPAIRVQLAADQMLVGGRRYDEVSVQAERTGAGTDLLIDSAAVAGMARWPAPPGPRRGRGGADAQPAELHLTRLDLPDGTLPSEGVGLIAALAPTARLSVDELNWRGRSLGRLTASLNAGESLFGMDDVRLINGTQDVRGVLRCQASMSQCRLNFTVDSSDSAATLADFGFTPDVAAAAASLSGEVEWHPAQESSWLASLRGTLAMRLSDGTLREWQRPQDDAGVAHPFGLFTIPALVSGLDAPGAAGPSLTKEQQDLHFAHLEADFELRDGQAVTSNLHFDGDAEILVRGRTGLVSRDYDQQVWILRGEERLPVAVRRFGATPRVAAAWLSLRDLFSGTSTRDRSNAVLRLQGSWDDPMVVAEN